MIIKCNDNNCNHNIENICTSDNDIDICFDGSGRVSADVNCSYSKKVKEGD